MNELVSIIVPVYNVQDYLDNCIKSIVNQTYKNIEIILIDDGSRDNSGEKCDLWQKCDRRIKVIHIKNQGVSNARNLGIANANGKYIIFVDSDDMMHIDLVSTMIKIKKKYDVDLCICGFYHVFTNKQMLIAEKEGKYSKKEFLAIMKKWKLSPLIGSPCNKLFEREKIVSNNIKYEPNTKYAEDYMFNLDYFMCVDTFYVVNRGLYYYNMETPGSLTKTNSIDRDLWTKTQKKVYIKTKKLENVIVNKTNKGLAAEVYIYMLTLNLYSRIGVQFKEELLGYWNEICQNEETQSILKDNKKIENDVSMNFKYKLIRKCILNDNIDQCIKRIEMLKKLIKIIRR